MRIQPILSAIRQPILGVQLHERHLVLRDTVDAKPECAVLVEEIGVSPTLWRRTKHNSRGECTKEAIFEKLGGLRAEFRTRDMATGPRVASTRRASQAHCPPPLLGEKGADGRIAEIADESGAEVADEAAPSRPRRSAQRALCGDRDKPAAFPHELRCQAVEKDDADIPELLIASKYFDVPSQQPAVFQRGDPTLQGPQSAHFGRFEPF
ncbi:hypothetical protein FB451DRAFT_1190409 [Mycena latifolia]|nr:hypothetical protein FB451DRAFT_1190409 [Mycena latifolia]